MVIETILDGVPQNRSVDTGSNRLPGIHIIIQNLRVAVIVRPGKDVARNVTDVETFLNL